MAQKRKIKYRGRTYRTASLRPGKRNVRVRSYCRRPRRLRDFLSDNKASEWGF